MKKIALLIFIATLVLGNNILVAQNMKLTIKQLEVEFDREVKYAETDRQINLMPEQVVTVIFHNHNGYKAGIVISTQHKSNRLKLKQRSFVEHPDGKRQYARTKKDVQMLKVSVPGSLIGRQMTSLLPSRGSLHPVVVRYQYELVY